MLNTTLNKQTDLEKKNLELKKEISGLERRIKVNNHSMT